MLEYSASSQLPRLHTFWFANMVEILDILKEFVCLFMEYQVMYNL